MEVKILMIVICWNIIYPIVARIFGLKMSAILSCGMIGFSSDHKADAGILRLLLMYNLERGEDSTGWAINNEVTKDIIDVKKFLAKNKLELLDEHENYTFIAHARKSSSGGKWSKELAHPFGVYKDGVEKAKYDLILAMNGTLINTTEMAKEFDVEYIQASNSDTQILSRIMAKLGEKDFIKALQTYDGAATLLFFTPKYTNTLMVYKDPGRPLFYWQKEKNEMYVSSMDNALFAAGAEKEDVHSFEDDTIYKINKGRITKETKIVRTPIKKEIKVYSNRNADYDMSYGGGGQQGKFFSSGNDSNMDLFRNSLVNTRKPGDIVYCLIDRYYRNGHPINNSLLLNDTGKEYSQRDNDDTTKFKRYYFVNGNMFKDEEAYNKIKELYPGSNNDVDLIKFKDMKMSRLCEYLAYPPIGIIDEKQKFILNSIWKEKVTTTGDKIKYCMPFTDIDIEIIWEDKCIEFKDGDGPEMLVRVCEIKSIKKKEGEIQEDRTANFKEDIRTLLNNHHNMSTSGLCERILINWKVNNTPNVKELFFNKLLDLFLEEKIINKETSYADLKLMGKGCLYNVEDKEFSEEVGKCIVLLRSKNDGKPIVALESIVSTHIGNENLNDDTVEDENQIESVIKSLESRNPFYQQKNFRDELYDADYDDLSLFAKEWTSSTNKLDPDVRVFCEAILLCLHKVGKITAEETIKIVELTDSKLHEETEVKYNSYHKDIKTDEDGVAEANVETWTIQDYEDDAINRYNDIKSKFEEEIREMELIPEDERSEKFKLILDFYIGTYSQMLSKKVEDEHKQ